MCEHKRLRCTNCVLYCLDCGAKVEAPKAVEKPVEKPEEKPKKKGAKAK